MSRKSKSWLLILGLLLFGFVLWNRVTLVYLFGQAKGQANILYNSRPLTEVLLDTTLTRNQRSKLKWIQSVKRYALDSLGMTGEASYSSFYDQNEEPILWNVQASRPYRLQPFLWSYPILGDLGYRGYFKYDLALAEHKRLSELGYDASMYEVQAWSTLGYLDDPILSSMLERDSLALATLIFHELTHTTFYYPSKGAFNENLAQFIGRKAMEQFVASEVPDGEKRISADRMKQEDKIKFRKFVISSAKFLEEAYLEFPDTLKKIPHLEIAKKALFERIRQGIDTIRFHDSTRFAFVADTSWNPSNAFFTGVNMYESQQDSFELTFKKTFNGNLRAFIQYHSDKN